MPVLGKTFILTVRKKKVVSRMCRRQSIRVLGTSHVGVCKAARVYRRVEGRGYPREKVAQVGDPRQADGSPSARAEQNLRLFAGVCLYGSLKMK